MFDEPMAIIACLLTAIVTSAITFFGTAMGIAWSVNVIDPTLKKLSLEKLGVSVVAVIAICFTAAWLISLGFSEKFFREVSQSSYYRHQFYEQNWFWLLVIVSIPAAIHFALTANSIRKSL
jgi:hypothetical protein